MIQDSGFWACVIIMIPPITIYFCNHSRYLLNGPCMITILFFFLSGIEVCHNSPKTLNKEVHFFPLHTMREVYITDNKTALRMKMRTMWTGPVIGKHPDVIKSLSMVMGTVTKGSPRSTAGPFYQEGWSPFSNSQFNATIRRPCSHICSLKPRGCSHKKTDALCV